MKKEFFDRLQERLDRPDTREVQAYLMRLAQEKGTLDTIFNTIHEGIIVFSRELSINYFNQASMELLGLPDNAAGQKISRFLRDIDWQECLQNEQAFHRREIEVNYPQQRFLTIYTVPQLDEHNEPNGNFTAVIHDNTEWREQADSRHESERLRLLTLLATGVAHELGNPLNSLSIHLQLMKRHLDRLPDESPELTEVRELMQISTEEVGRMDGIIRQFLGALRSEEPEMQALNAGELLQSALTFMDSEIKSRNIELKLIFNESLPLIQGDPVQLKQAFFNILKNALQSMPRGGILAVGCCPHEGGVKISFADSGDGISLDNIGRIFNAGKSDRHSGTGLGLFIVEKILREHGGHLEISSVEGEGTVLSLILPQQGSRMRLIEQAPISTCEDSAE